MFCLFFRKGFFKDNYLIWYLFWHQSIGKRQIVLISAKMNRRWICSDVWMDILPSFERVELGLKMALISDRFDILVDAHFDGKNELTIWKTIKISKDKGQKAKLSVRIDGKWAEFPLPDHSLPNKIRFHFLWIEYIDHSVIEFLRSNKQIWDRMGTKLGLNVRSDETEDYQRIWDIFVRQIWPLFVPNIRHLRIEYADDLDNLRRRTSPTILTDLDHLNSIDSDGLLPDWIADDGPNATARQALSKWLHTPSKNGQPKRLHCYDYFDGSNLDWVNNLKEAFPRAISSVSYIIRIDNVRTMPTEPFELENERTKEKLTLEKVSRYDVVNLLLKRCQIGETVQWKNDKNLDDKLNNVTFNLWRGNDTTIGPLSPPPTEEEADQSSQNVVSDCAEVN